MIPDDAVERLMDSALEIGKAQTVKEFPSGKSLHHKDTATLLTSKLVKFQWLQVEAKVDSEFGL